MWAYAVPLRRYHSYHDPVHPKNSSSSNVILELEPLLKSIPLEDSDSLPAKFKEPDLISTYFEKFAKRPPPPLLPEFEELLLFPVLGVVPTVSCGPSVLDEGGCALHTIYQRTRIRSFPFNNFAV